MTKTIQTTYRLTMSDGTLFQIRTDDAGKAIEAALWQFRGRTVLSRYSGVTEEDCARIKQEFPDKNPTPGIVPHDIPFHDPVSPEATLPAPRPAKLPDPGTALLFPDALHLDHT